MELLFLGKSLSCTGFSWNRFTFHFGPKNPNTEILTFVDKENKGEDHLKMIHTAVRLSESQNLIEIIFLF